MAKTTKKKHLHERRGVSFATLLCLLGVREALQQKLVAQESRGNEYTAKCKSHFFNMDTWGSTNEHCGSVGCIGGIIRQIGSHEVYREVGEKSIEGQVLRNLFYPDTQDFDWDKITPAMAVRAIDNWLENGKPRWRAVVKGA